MLVLTRRAGERVVIDEAIVVTVLRVEGDRVRIGISAPKEVPVRRAELPARPASGGPAMVDASDASGPLVSAGALSAS
ncbi:MAG: carbon storage regulator [Planctomycetia bacterium]|nr:carbon storage regulator [Planctomycetia bacterium]